ncbi:MAG: hypothetical protein PHH08_00520 [Candidatus ainarchaeum sp.]|nr:hypothetical protein [Candidatus ainarchaeum sp.]
MRARRGGTKGQGDYNWISESQFHRKPVEPKPEEIAANMKNNAAMIAKWIKRNSGRELTPEQKKQVAQVVSRNSRLSPGDFHDKVIPIIQKIIGG